MSTFAAIPVRGYTLTDPSWWNALQAAGLTLEGIIGAGGIGETTFSFANNQVSAANVTGLVFDHTVNHSALCTISQRIQTASNELYCITRLAVNWKDVAAAWAISQLDDGPDTTGLIFSIVAGTGQVQYTSPNMAGTGYSGASRFKATIFGL